MFPFGEVRDSAGRITGAHGLASFRSGWALADRYRDWHAAVRERRSREPSKQWLTGVMFAVATALLSGALSLLPGMARRMYPANYPHERLAVAELIVGAQPVLLGQA